jgi:DNA-binding protein HU-beta
VPVLLTAQHFNERIGWNLNTDNLVGRIRRIHVNKQELIAEVAAKSSVSKKDADLVINNTIATITKTLKKGEKVQLIGFGTFETRKRKARKGRNPRKPEELINIPASTAPVFKAGKALKDAVSKKK